MKSDITSEQIHTTLMTVINRCNDLKGGQLYRNTTSHHALCNKCTNSQLNGGHVKSHCLSPRPQQWCGSFKKSFQAKNHPQGEWNLKEVWWVTCKSWHNEGFYVFFFHNLLHPKRACHSLFWTYLFFLKYHVFLFLFVMLYVFFWNIMRNNFI